MPSTPSASAQPSSVAPAQGMANLTPVAPDERIQALDLLRGWAMFGVLWSNIINYGTLDPTTALDRGLSWMQGWMIDGRFYRLLCLLFGIGFGIQLLRATERGVDVRTVYYRRSLALLAIGEVHALLIWDGDVLTIYALVAFALVMFRTASTRRILTAAVLLWFVAPEVVIRARHLAGMNFFMPSVENATTAWIYGHGSWLQIEPIRVACHLQWLGRFGLGLYCSILAVFLMGFWSMKSGYLRRVIEDPRTTRRLLFGALVAAAIGYAWSANYTKLLPSLFSWSVSTRLSDPHFWVPRQLIFKMFNWSTEGTAVAYAAILLLLWQRPRIARLLRPLAATGRMALTTYLTQSIVCTLLFYGYGLGWYGHVGYSGMFLITLILFACQMAASSWWLTRFRFGPVEWLWRTLTYGRAPRMRVSFRVGGERDVVSAEAKGCTPGALSNREHV